MQMLRVFALIYFAAAGLLVAGAVSLGQWVLVAAALTAALGGVLLMAVDLALVRLTEIRDALRGDIPQPEMLPPVAEAQPAQAGEVQLSDVEARLKAMRAKGYQ
ncbi:MAG: hypothetical protein KBF78_17210 [Fuscovulum sp.]|nr:hypothetical protein [Fuscovulum sp.]